MIVRLNLLHRIPQASHNTRANVVRNCGPVDKDNKREKHNIGIRRYDVGENEKNGVNKEN